MSKYDPLWRYIQVNCAEHEKITFSKAEEVSDVKIEPDFRFHRKELTAYGFKVEQVSWKNKYFEVSML